MAWRSSTRAWTKRPLWQLGLGASAVAAVANVGVYYLALATGVSMELTEVFQDEFEPMPVQNVVFATFLDGGVVAWLTAIACRWWAPRPHVWFLTLATIGTVGSFAAPIASDASASTVSVLSLTHVMAAIIIVPPLAFSLGRADVMRRRARTIDSGG